MAERMTIDAHHSVLAKRLAEQDSRGGTAKGSPKRAARELVYEAGIDEGDGETEWVVFSYPDPDDDGVVEEIEGRGCKAAVKTVKALAQEVQSEILA